MNKKENAVKLPHCAQRKHALLVKTKEKSKSKKIATRKKVALKLLPTDWDIDLPGH